MNKKDINKVREILMNEANCKFTVKGMIQYGKKEDGSYGDVPKVFHTVKLDHDEYCGSISEGWYGMNVTKWGPTCVTLYTYDMLGKRSSGKIRYSDIEFVEPKVEESNSLKKLPGFLGTEKG